MRLRTVLTIGGAILALCLAAMLLVDNPEDKSIDASYLIEDWNDRLAYQRRGRWLPSGLVPYVELHSEHIQISTWLMAVPYLFMDHGIERGDYETQEELVANRRAYGDLFQVGAGVFLFALLWITALNLRTLGHDPAWALLLLLPATLYHGFNRFDPVVTTWIALALFFQLRGRILPAAFMIGVAAMTKWYPILLLPAFASYNLHAGRAQRLARGDPAPFGPALLRGVLWPGLVAGGVCFVVLAITYAWGETIGKGVEAVRYLVDWHFGKREPNHASLMSMVSHPDRLGWFDMSKRPLLTRICSLMQIVPAFLLGLVPIRRRRDLLLACLAVTTGVVLWSKFFSPQWVIWITSIAVLLVPGRRLFLAVVVVFQVLIYVQLPVLYYYSTGSPAFWGVSYTRVALFALFWLGCLVAVLVAARDRSPEQDSGEASDREQGAAQAPV